MSALEPSNLLSVTAEFYTANPSLEDGRLKIHRIEFEVTLWTILKYLPKAGGKILDVGAVPLEAIISKTDPAIFDVVLLLGPLYHIMSPSLRESAIKQAWTMVKPSGVLICAWVSRWAHYRDVAMRDPGRLHLKEDFYRKHASDGDYVRVDSHGTPVHAMNHELPINMPLLLKKATGLEEVQMVGVEGILAGGLDRLVNDLEGDAFEAWVQKCLDVGNSDNGWMMSDHIIGIARRS
ncbi:hypothetical protein EIP91_004665 [Steccherinum ochraceum]|uniref:Methyltransferase type 11 domain-containing protein n=1 Tax=Steccherinum ochraceum TaxID=92696 RepID=A0A4R0R8H0_9APHY|nr:hypothetical protein EIP91_004665 [Steccherinum ochraceum]